MNGQAVSVQPSAPRGLAEGDQVEVAAGGLARIAYPDGTRMLLLANGSKAGALVIAKPAGGVGDVVLKLLNGAVSFLIPKDRQPNANYQFQALNTVTTIKGTSGRITTAAEADQVALREGVVVVTATASGTMTEVKAGSEVVVEPGKAPVVRAYNTTASSELPFWDFEKANRLYGTH